MSLDDDLKIKVKENNYKVRRRSWLSCRTVFGRKSRSLGDRGIKPRLLLKTARPFVEPQALRDIIRA